MAGGLKGEREVKTPFEVHFEIERRCRLLCRHCSSHAIRDMERRGYTLRQMCALTELLGDYAVHVYLTGGEPLLCGDLTEHMAALSALPVETHIGLFTSGIVMRGGAAEPLSAAQAAEMRQAGLENCYLSVYSARPEIHDTMTRTPSSFAMTRQAMESLRRAGVDVRFNSVVYAGNERELDGLLDYAAQVGASEVRLLKLIRHGSAAGVWEDLRLKSGVHSDRMQALLASRSGEEATRITISGHPQLAPCRPFDTAQGCQAGCRLLYVTYAGDVYPCACVKNNEKYRIGHIADAEGLRQALQSLPQGCRFRCLSGEDGQS